jgi:hypothetical protein
VRFQQVWNMRDAEKKLHRQFKRHHITSRNHWMLRGCICDGDTELFELAPWNVLRAEWAMMGMGRFAWLDQLLPAGLALLLMAFAANSVVGMLKNPPSVPTGHGAIGVLRNQAVSVRGR